MKIVVDTDPGVDDVLALLYLHRHPRVEIAAITTVAGNGTLDAVTRNARYVAERFGLRAPLARGAGSPLEGELHLPPAHIHGQNAFGDVTVTDSAYPLDARPAHRMIIDTVRARPGEITILALGMLTNVARALLEDPAIAPLVRSVVVMGGAFMGFAGNASPVAEANVYGDPTAADIVFTAQWPVRVVGLNVTERVVMTPAYLASLASGGTAEARFIREVTRGYEAFHRGRDGMSGIFAHDPAAAVCALDEAPFTFASGPVRVVRDGVAAGLTLQKRPGRAFPPNGWDGAPPQEVAVDIDAARVLDLFAAPFL